MDLSFRILVIGTLIQRDANLKLLVCVTNSYLLSTRLKLSSYQLAVGPRVLQFKGVTAVVHGCSFMPGPNQEGRVLGCNAGWGLVSVGSSLAPVPLQLCKTVSPLRHSHWEEYKHSALVHSLFITPETG